MTLNTEHVINSRGTHSPLTIDYSLYSIDHSPFRAQTYFNFM